MAELEAERIGFQSVTESIDTTTPGGKLVFHIFGALAEFERNLIRERTYAGLAAARARGRKGGRRKKLGEKQRAVAVDLYRQNTPSRGHLNCVVERLRVPLCGRDRPGLVGRRGSGDLSPRCHDRGSGRRLQESLAIARDPAPPRLKPGAKSGTISQRVRSIPAISSSLLTGGPAMTRPPESRPHGAGVVSQLSPAARRAAPRAPVPAEARPLRPGAAHAAQGPRGGRAMPGRRGGGAGRLAPADPRPDDGRRGPPVQSRQARRRPGAVAPGQAR